MKTNVLTTCLALCYSVICLQLSAQTKTDKVLKPYSDYVVQQGVVYTSGLLGLDAAGRIPSTFEQEVLQLFGNLDQVLSTANSSKEKIFSVTVYLSSMTHFNTFNRLYTAHFKTPYPVRTCVAVQELARNAHIEISAMARL
ncbi:RidA family protein [Olivibacter sp. SA151]|uniref:RidA family protein n=1 Tax=Olivibacter jilunii TaxID=985016 RepID=UPI003F134F22